MTQELLELAAKGLFRKTKPITNYLKNIGRNEPCPCDSGKKYKKCCWLTEQLLKPLENSDV